MFFSGTTNVKPIRGTSSQLKPGVLALLIYYMQRYGAVRTSDALVVATTALHGIGLVNKVARDEKSSSIRRPTSYVNQGQTSAFDEDYRRNFAKYA